MEGCPEESQRTGLEVQLTPDTQAGQAVTAQGRHATHNLPSKWNLLLLLFPRHLQGKVGSWKRASRAQTQERIQEKGPCQDNDPGVGEDLEGHSEAGQPTTRRSGRRCGVVCVCTCPASSPLTRL